MTIKKALTNREHEVAQLVAEGHSNKIIAARLGISDTTAKFHVINFIAKMNAQTRVDAAVKYSVARVMGAQTERTGLVPA
jgi:two-component system, NarL family, nitrate/nitrite response regulator NarL